MTTRAELISLCRERGIKGYSGRKKEELQAMLTATTSTAADSASPAPTTSKKTRGQFYTTNASYILGDFPAPPSTARCVMEPFAGKGDLLDWVRKTGSTLPIEAYDIEPKCDGTIKQDTLKTPPDYSDCWILTNPPYLARNKSTNKELYDTYDTNDLYKCFLLSMIEQTPGPCGGIVLIPAGFFFSPRDIDVRCRDRFMSKYRILKVRYFEETVFSDTSTTIVAILFERHAATPPPTQDVDWELMPAKETRTFPMSRATNWIIGGDIYNLPRHPTISIRRHVEGVPLRDREQQTYLTLNALDSGTAEGGRIGLQYEAGVIYPAKECSRTYATLRITGRTLSAAEQIAIAERFNTFLEEHRAATWSLFLPQFRESKEYARKRIPFELAYGIIEHLLLSM